MKISVLALALLSLAPLGAFAAPGATCKILIASDPVNKPQDYDLTIHTLNVAPDEQTHYVLLSKDAKTAEEISRDTYKKYKDEKFAAIDGQYVVFYLQSEGLTLIAYGIADQKAGDIINGASVYGVKSENTIILPMGAAFGAECGFQKE